MAWACVGWAVEKWKTYECGIIMEILPGNSFTEGLVCDPSQASIILTTHERPRPSVCSLAGATKDQAVRGVKREM